MQNFTTSCSREPGGIFSRLHSGSFALKFFLGLMILLQIGDGLLTNQLVSRGLAQEGNLFVKSIALNGDFIGIKILGAVICGLALWQLSLRFRNLALIALCSINGFYAAVFAWNMGIVF